MPQKATGCGELLHHFVRLMRLLQWTGHAIRMGDSRILKKSNDRMLPRKKVRVGKL